MECIIADNIATVVIDEHRNNFHVVELIWGKYIKAYYSILAKTNFICTYGASSFRQLPHWNEQLPNSIKIC